MLPRKISPTLRQRLHAYPAAALVGPRQCGKTTLARSLGGRYYDLEQEPDRLRLDLEWNRIIAGSELVILDEAQAWPDIFPMLRGAIDGDRRRNGRFLLLGSVSPSLMTQVSESLAGRLSVVELTPFSISELETEVQRSRRWLVGGYADGGVLRGRGHPTWQLDYLTLLAQRDLPNWGLPASAQVTERLLRMLAAVHGQEWNATQIGKSLALSYHTVNGYLDFLDSAFLIRRLPAWHANIRKRLVKRPKVYWRDSGLLHALSGVSDQNALLLQPWVGASWEGFAIDQVLTALQHADRRWRAFHMRTADQREIDLVLEVGTNLWALEMKLTARPRPQDVARLNANADLIDADRRFLVCQQCEFLESGPRIVCDLGGLIAYIERSASPSPEIGPGFQAKPT